MNFYKIYAGVDKQTAVGFENAVDYTTDREKAIELVDQVVAGTHAQIENRSHKWAGAWHAETGEFIYEATAA